MTQEQIMEGLKLILIVGFSISVLFSIIRYIILEYRGHKNRTAPVFTERATVYHKHEETDAPYLGRGYSYVYYITFHTDFGQALKLYMTRDDFYILHEGDKGQLTWQGEKFWKFVPETK